MGGSAGSYHSWGSRFAGASNFHSAIADGRFHSFSGARSAGSTLAGSRFAGNGFNRAGFVGGNAGWRGGYGYGRYGYGYGRGWGGYGWGGGWGWGGWGWGLGMGRGLPYRGWGPHLHPYWGWPLYGYKRKAKKRSVIPSADAVQPMRGTPQMKIGVKN